MCIRDRMVSTASRVGTGNIVGIATAVCLGGYGAVFWMWVIAILGGASAFIESTVTQIYKKKHPDGGSYGGPAYYIEAVLHSRPLALLFAVSMLLTYAGGFNMLASYNLQSTFSGYSFYDPQVSPWIIGGILAVAVGYCLMGGGKRIVKFTSTLVPIMGILYVLWRCSSPLRTSACCPACWLISLPRPSTSALFSAASPLPA